MSSFAFIQSASKTAAGATTIAYTSNTTAGSLLIFVHACFSGGVPTSVTDTQGNAWRRIGYVKFASSNISVWAALATVGGANTVTQSSGSANTDTGYAVLEYSAPSSYSACAGSAVFAASSVTTLSTYAGLKLLNDSLVVVSYFDQSTGHTTTSSDLTVRETRSITGGEALAVGDDFPTTVALTKTWALSWTGASSNNGLVVSVFTNDPAPSGGSVAANAMGGFIG